MSSKKYVKMVKMDFSKLAKSYNLVNHFMSLGVDNHFRYIATKYFIFDNPANITNILDVGVGTGHLSDKLHYINDKYYIIGLDITDLMIKYTKTCSVYKSGNMDLILGDAAKTPFKKNSFDGIMSGFVGRHFTDYPITLSEHYRILKDNGRLMMLEMGRRSTSLSIIIDKYIGALMGILGRIAAYLISRQKVPFRLLEETYIRYRSPKELNEEYLKIGFKSKYKTFFMGSIVVILAKKFSVK